MYPSWNIHKLIIIFKVTVVFLIGCSNISNRPEEVTFFNLTPPGDTAIKFAPGIVSTINHEHSRITFSNDGYLLLWAVIPVDTNYSNSSGQLNSDKQNIWKSELISGKWTNPGILKFTKESGGGGPVFSGNGKELFYRSPKSDVDSLNRPKPI